MKTNVVLRSVDRDLFGVTIRQSTKGEMLSVTDLQKAYDKARYMHGWKDRRIERIMVTSDFQERVFYVLKKLDLVKTQICVFTEMAKNEGVTKVLKGLGVWKTTGRGVNKTTIANPYIWILLAMEMNPLIYAEVVVWLTDTLIFDRIEAGTEYLPMNAAIKQIVPIPNYPAYAKEINIKVFGAHQRGIRNIAGANELRKIADVEKFITNAISMKLIKNELDIFLAIKSYK